MKLTRGNNKNEISGRGREKGDTGGCGWGVAGGGVLGGGAGQREDEEEGRRGPVA